MDLVKALADSIDTIAYKVLENSRGAGHWKTRANTNRQAANDDIAKGLCVGDTVFSFDPDLMEFESAVVVHVDASGVAYRVWDHGQDDTPFLSVVWRSWAKTKREALLSVNPDIKASLESMLAELS